MFQYSWGHDQNLQFNVRHNATSQKSRLGKSTDGIGDFLSDSYRQVANDLAFKDLKGAYRGSGILLETYDRYRNMLRIPENQECYVIDRWVKLRKED